MVVIRSSSKRGESKTYTGTTGADVFYGAYGNDIFAGLGGMDTFFGGYGNDRVDYRWAKSPIRVDLGYDGFQNTGGGGSNRLVNIAGLYGSPYDDWIQGGNSDGDWLSGEGGNDTMMGGYGRDMLQGGSGQDSLDGGTGDDILRGDAGSDLLHGRDANDLLEGGADSDRLYGDAGNDGLDGGSGDDFLVGGAGSDRLAGGAGTDTASYATASRPILINLLDVVGYYNEGDAAGDTYSSIESFELSPWDDQFFASNVGAVAHGGAGDDRIVGRAGKDVLYGDDGNDRLEGGTENDVLWGGAGRDTFIGGAGIDAQIGGTGADTFVYLAWTDSVRPNPDRIHDFSRAEGDRIDLSRIDAVPGGADNSFTFIGRNAFTGVAGQLSVQVGPDGFWQIGGDVNGDRVADFFLYVASATQPLAADFVL